MSFWPGNSPFRLRFTVQNNGDPMTGTFEIRVSKNFGPYQPITSSSSIVKSVDAGASTDETPINQQDLTTPT